MVKVLKDIIKLIIHYISILVAYIITSNKKLKELENSKSNKTIYCVGGGPSLNSIDLSMLNGKQVILTNFSYKILDKCQPDFSISLVQDTRRMYDMRNVNRSLFDYSIKSVYGRPILLLKFLWEKSIRNSDILMIPKMYGIYRDTKWKKEDLLSGKKINGNIQIGSSIILTAIQLAYYMGAKRIVLVGVDLIHTPTLTHFDDNREIDRKMVGQYEVFDKMISDLKDISEILNIKGIEIYNTSPITNETFTRKISLEEAVNTFKY